MRYYNIVITPVGGEPMVITTGDTKDNYSALQVELDIYQSLMHSPEQAGTVKIRGYDFKDLTIDLNPDVITKEYATIQISVGMSKGLPFANQNQKGLIVSGLIFRAFSNWQGNNISLDIIVGGLSLLYSSANPANLIWAWTPDQTMQQAIGNTLKGAFTVNNIPPQINGTLSPNLVYTETPCAWYPNASSFASMILRLSKDIIKEPTYLGVTIDNPNNEGFVMYDGTVPNVDFARVDYTDMIGNATWIDAFTIQIKVAMRGDLTINQYIILPVKGLGLAVSALNPLNYYKNTIPFQNVMLIKRIHHMGNSRQADANSWVTVIDCYAGDIPQSVLEASTSQVIP